MIRWKCNGFCRPRRRVTIVRYEDAGQPLTPWARQHPPRGGRVILRIEWVVGIQPTTPVFFREGYALYIAPSRDIFPFLAVFHTRQGRLNTHIMIFRGCGVEVPSFPRHRRYGPCGAIPPFYLLF